MDVAVVMAVGAGPEHGGEAAAGARAQGFAQRLVDRHVGQAERAAVGERERAHVDGVAVAVIAELGADHPVAGAAFVSRRNSRRCAVRTAELRQARRRLVAQPAGERLRHLAGQHRRRLDLDARAVGKPHRVELRPCRGRRRRRARSGAASARWRRSSASESQVGRLAGDLGGVEVGAGGLAESQRLDPDRRARTRQRHVLGGGEAAAEKPRRKTVAKSVRTGPDIGHGLRHLCGTFWRSRNHCAARCGR